MRSRFAVVSAIAFALASLLGVSGAQAQYFGQNKVQHDQFNFKTLETENFVFHYYPEEEQAVRDAARMAERWYSRHTQIFLHRFDEKKPVIFYANDADFMQTNVTPGNVSQATGGLTEPLKERVVMPLATSYGETDHVIGHELVHSFQFDLALNGNQRLRLQNIPLWVVEGMAEYLSVGRKSTHTAMWMRDAVRRDGMPSFRELANPREYFPYRYGHAYLAYLAGKYGDQSIPDLFKMGGQIGVDSAHVALFGVSPDSLVNEWARATRKAYLPLMENRTSPDSAGTKILAPDIDGGRVNIAPSVSPDGRWVAFISERELFNFSLSVANAETGEVIADLDQAGSTGHFNALRFIGSAGAWSPDGRRMAFVTFAEGDNQLTIWNVQEEEIERSFKVEGVTSMKNPAWSPDGNKLAFTGTDGGISDLYLLNLDTKNVRQLTDDRYADLQPTWSPDGETIAFTTDRAEFDLDVLDTSSKMDIGLIDVESGEVTVRQPFGKALHHNPQFSPNGRSLYFISDQDGFKDVYRMELASGDLFRVTHLKTGVSGITALSPAMSVASRSGEMMFSVYGDGRYTGFKRSSSEVQGTPLAETTTAQRRGGPRLPTGATDEEVRMAAADTTEAGGGGAPADTTETDPSGAMTADAPDADTTDEGTTAAARDTSTRAGVLPPYGARGEGMIAANLRDSTSGLPPASEEYESEDYDPSLQLDRIFSPGVGVQVGGRFGSGLAGGVGVRFSDMLGDQVLTGILQAQGSFRDIGGSVSYLNQRNQLNWGGSISHIPIIFSSNTLPFRGGTAVSVNRRAFITSGSINTSYPLDTTRRFEFSLTGTRYGFGVNIREFGFDGDASVEDVNQFLRDRDAGFQLREETDTEYLGSAELAYVRDFTTQGITGPIRGGRWRIGVSPTTGSQDFVTVRADLRRYFYTKPFTFALQALHVGNYGAEFEDNQSILGVGQEFIGFPLSQGFVRGYNVRNIQDGIAENLREPGVSSSQEAGCTPPEKQVAERELNCAETQRLFGTRSLTTRFEFRVPLLGPERLSLIPFRFVPTTLALFTDAGVTWTRDEGPELEFETDGSEATNIPVVSNGVAARFNILGAILLEAYYARPYQRIDTTWELGFRIASGF